MKPLAIFGLYMNEGLGYGEMETKKDIVCIMYDILVSSPLKCVWFVGGNDGRRGSCIGLFQRFSRTAVCLMNFIL